MISFSPVKKERFFNDYKYTNNSLADPSNWSDNSVLNNEILREILFPKVTSENSK